MVEESRRVTAWEVEANWRDEASPGENGRMEESGFAMARQGESVRAGKVGAGDVLSLRGVRMRAALTGRGWCGRIA